MRSDRGPIRLVEVGGGLFLLRDVLDMEGDRTGVFEYATSRGSGLDLEWHAVAASAEVEMRPLVIRPPGLLDSNSAADHLLTGLIETKSEFARRCSVHPSRVGQWIKSGAIDKRALFGLGGYARIRVDVAIDQLRRRRGRGWKEREKLSSKE